MNMEERINYVTQSIQRVSGQAGAPFLEVLALFEDYAVKMVQIYYFTGGYPDFSHLLEVGEVNGQGEGY